MLYYGMMVLVVFDICVYGFNCSFCGCNVMVYGKGVYFVRCVFLLV